MLGKIKNYVAKKVASTEWGIEAMKKEIDKMPIPEHAKQMFRKVMENKPELLMKIAEETQKLIDEGKNQMAAGQSVMMKYQKELREAMLGK